MCRALYSCDDDDELTLVGPYKSRISSESKTTKEKLLLRVFFMNNAEASAAVLQANSEYVNGRPYYKLSVPTRTADGGEGGKHQLIAANVKDGNLYTFKAQAGDKRWFKGVKFVEGPWNSFNVA
uniref:23 kDa subunit of oxygen evolving system of photosystem II n=1 Tax=Physcomitrium patens TaxID=3218 RepID=A0A2K1JUR2_PHYPA|nr:hypothetical protein PHYPA_015032 [Physcomitrium patens]